MKNKMKSAALLNRRHKIFLSHSGDLSTNLARLFKDFLRNVLAPTEPFFSEETIYPGMRWAHELDENLRHCQYGLFFITKDNAYASTWMLYEAGAIAALNNGDNRVIPILIDIPDNELPAIYTAFQWMRFEEKLCRRLIYELNEHCSDSAPISADVLEKHFGAEWPKLCESWENMLAESRRAKTETLRLQDEERRQQELMKQLWDERESMRKMVVFDNDKFYNWAYAMHNVVHLAREACVLMMGSHQRDDKLPPGLEGGVPPYHPGMAPFTNCIRDILKNVRELFEKLPETADCDVRVCLRDLRHDGNFYTFARSRPSHLDNHNTDNNSVPISKDCAAFKELEETWGRAKCVIETTPELGWDYNSDRYPNNAFYQTKSVLIGSVIAKEVRHGIISNAYTVWAIFVSANKEGVFKTYHHAILQACNDALSCMANLMLRKDSCLAD